MSAPTRTALTLHFDRDSSGAIVTVRPLIESADEREAWNVLIVALCREPGCDSITSHEAHKVYRWSVAE